MNKLLSGIIRCFGFKIKFFCLFTFSEVTTESVMYAREIGQYVKTIKI